MTWLAHRVHGRTRIDLVLLSACGWLFFSSPSLAAGAPLTCGDPAALYRIEIIEQRLDTSFELFADWRVQREADQRWAQESEGRPPAADRSDPTREFQSRTAKEMALESVRFLVELTGSPCDACGADDGVDWDKFPQDIEQWGRLADRYRQTARQTVYDEQRKCVLQLLNRRDAELSALALDLAAGGPGSESTALEFPSSLELMFGKDRAASVSLTPIIPRSPWSAAELSFAQRFSAHLRQFIERGTPAAWRALVGAGDREAYRARLHSGAAELREKLLRLRAELEAYATQVQALFESEGYPPPWPEEGVEESAENKKLRDRERVLDHQAGVFDAPQIWHRFRIDGESDSAATGRIQLPRTPLYTFLLRGASEGPDGPAGFRQSVTRYRRALDDCLDTLDAGFSIDPERR